MNGLKKFILVLGMLSMTYSLAGSKCKELRSIVHAGASNSYTQWVQRRGKLYNSQLNHFSRKIDKQTAMIFTEMDAHNCFYTPQFINDMIIYENIKNEIEAEMREWQ